MAARKRVPLKPKSLLNQIGSSSTRSSTTSQNKGSEAINKSDYNLYLRLSLLIIVILAVGGFLLYPDILNIVRTVRDKTFKNAHLSEKTEQKSQEDELFINAKHFYQHDDDDDDDKHVEPLPDDYDDVVALGDYTEDEDLMEDEEADKKLEHLKNSNQQNIETNISRETKTSQRNSPIEKEHFNGKSSSPEAKSQQQHTVKPQRDKKSTSDSNSQQDRTIKLQKDKTLSSDVNSKQEQNVRPQKDKDSRRTGPILLNAENNQVVLDPSQIKFVDSSSNKKVHTNHGQSKETKNIPKKKEINPNKSSTGDKAEKAIKNINEDKRKQNQANTEANSKKPDNNKVVSNRIESLDNIVEEAKKFNSTFQKTFTPKKIFADGRRIPPLELLHQKKSNSSVRVFLFDDFLSQQECDGLIKAHDNHVKAFDKPPILCFDSIGTLRKHIKDVKKKVEVTPNDFTKGTKCVNASFSLQLQTWMKSNWSYSTAFYPGESTFSKVIPYRIKEAMGLDPASGGKFQITSYPEGKAYKEHTDCTLGGVDQRDRVVSVLMYLSNVEEGGETSFPELGIWVKPKKGRALVWNNMSPDGVCEEHSNHVASVVKKGSKYILIRWYYYKTFYSLGRRPPPPDLPEREPGQPMVNCDEYNSGSCRWYDEWSYEPLLQYEKNKYNLI